MALTWGDKNDVRSDRIPDQQDRRNSKRDNRFKGGAGSQSDKNWQARKQDRIIGAMAAVIANTHAAMADGSRDNDPYSSQYRTSRNNKSRRGGGSGGGWRDLKRDLLGLIFFALVLITTMRYSAVGILWLKGLL